MDDSDGDAFETVAITWSQPEAAVMLSMFAFYGIPAFTVGRHHISAQPTHAVALQGIAIRVAADAMDEALDLLADVAERPAVVRPYPLGSATFYQCLVVFALFLTGLAAIADDASSRVLFAAPLILLLGAAPPTRTTATFMLWKRDGPVGD